MKIISNKNRNKWANFLIITSILTIWLSIAYVAHPNASSRVGYLDFQLAFERLNLDNLYIYFFPQSIQDFSYSNPPDITGIYFFANSFILMFLGILLKNKKLYAYNILSVFLFASFAVGYPFSSVYLSVLFGLSPTYGGSLIIPLFHVAVIGSFVSSFKRLSGKTKYEGEISVLPDQPAVS